MGFRTPYSKSFLGSLAIHVAILFFLIFSFNQRVHISNPASGTIIEAVMVDTSEKIEPMEAVEQQAVAEQEKKQEAQKKV